MQGAPKSGIVDTPEIVKMTDDGNKPDGKKIGVNDPQAANEYMAIDVACGSSFVAVVARKDEMAEVAYEIYDAETNPIKDKLADELLKLDKKGNRCGDLLSIFPLYKDAGYRELFATKRSRKDSKKRRATMEAGGNFDNDQHEIEEARTRLNKMAQDESSKYSIPIREEEDWLKFLTAKFKFDTFKPTILKRTFKLIHKHVHENNKYRTDAHF